MKKRLLAALLCVVMLVTMVPMFAAAQETATYTLDITKGNVTTSATAITGFDANGNAVSIPFGECTKGNVVVTGTVTTSTPEVNRFDLTIPSGRDVSLTLKDFHRTSTSETGSDGIVLRGHAGGKLTFYVDGENSFIDTATYSAIVFGGLDFTVEGLNGKDTDKLTFQHGFLNNIGTPGNVYIKNVTLALAGVDINGIRSEGYNTSGKLFLDTTAQITDNTGVTYPGTGTDIANGYVMPEPPVDPDLPPVIENAEKAISATGADGTWIKPQSAKGSEYVFLPSSADYKALYFPVGLLVSANGKSAVSDGEPIDVTALVGSDMKAGVVYNLILGDQDVKVMKSANVSAVFVDLDEDNLSWVHQNKENRTTGKLVMIGADGETYTDVLTSFKGRGNHTWTAYNKKPYNIKLEGKTNLLNGQTDETKSYSLLANADDGSLSRNTVGMSLANKLGVGLGAQEPVDLWIDGEYRGNYLLTPKNDTYAPEPGFQVEIDNNYDNEDPQFVLNNWRESGYVNRFTVKAYKGYEVDAIQAHLQTIWDAICDQDSDAYLDLIDEVSWANFYLFQEFIRDGDPVSGSKLMHYDPEVGQLEGGPVWDLGYSMGRTYDNGRSGGLDILSAEGWWVEALNTGGASYWIQELGKHESFMKVVYEQYNLHKADFDAVDDETNQLAEDMGASAAMNYTMWNLRDSNLEYHGSDRTVGSGDYVQKYVKTSSWADFMTNLATYTETRARFLADHILNGSVELTQEDGVLTANAQCSGENLVYAWYDGETLIEGETGAVLDAEDYAGKTITVKVSDPALRGVLTSEAVTVEESDQKFDINDDGIINQLDLTRAQRFYGKAYPAADLDGDGTVTILDLIQILIFLMG